MKRRIILALAAATLIALFGAGLNRASVIREHERTEAVSSATENAHTHGGEREHFKTEQRVQCPRGSMDGGLTGA